MFGRILPLPPGPYGESGSALVELALVVTFLFVLLLGTVELTFLLLDYNALTKSVRDAARFWGVQTLDPAMSLPELTATLGPAYGSQPLDQTLENLVRCRAVICDGTTAVYPVVTAAYCKDHDAIIYVTIEAESPHAFHAFPLVTGILGESITLRASTVLRMSSLAGSTRYSEPACKR